MKNELKKLLKKKSFYIVTFIFILFCILTNVIYKESGEKDVVVTPDNPDKPTQPTNPTIPVQPEEPEIEEFTLSGMVWLDENENGKLMISKETIENLVETVARDFKEAESISTRVELDKENNVKIYANLYISSDAVIKDLSVNLQNKIKEKIKLAADLDVKEVNISVKKVAQAQEKNA